MYLLSRILEPSHVVFICQEVFIKLYIFVVLCNQIEIGPDHLLSFSICIRYCRKIIRVCFLGWKWTCRIFIKIFRPFLLKFIAPAKWFKIGNVYGIWNVVVLPTFFCSSFLHVITLFFHLLIVDIDYRQLKKVTT